MASILAKDAALQQEQAKEEDKIVLPEETKKQAFDEVNPPQTPDQQAPAAAQEAAPTAQPAVSQPAAVPETAPADAVENFHSLLLSGKWDEAEAMCGSGMDRYISSFREEWEMNMDKDSSVLEAAVRILREQGITVTGTSKGKDGKYFVNYTISAGEEAKEKTAELKRDGERWTIDRIRDAKAR